MLTAAKRARGRGKRRDTYGEIRLDDILGDYDAAVRRYVDTLSATWEESWTDAMAHALDVTEYEKVGLLDLSPSDYEPLVGDSRAVVDYDRATVTEVVRAALADGASPSEVAKLIREAEPFGPVRAFRIARTETLRSQESGYERRIWRASTVGVPILGNEWLSDPVAAKWKRRHDLLHGVKVPLGGVFRYPTSGITTAGPGLSGDPGEDINCRCARRAWLRPKGG